MAYAIVALFFLRFWRRTHDRLFLAFGAAFALLALQRVVLVITTRWLENSAWLYTIRLAAFALLLIAILDKNRTARG
jgi:hypothetical protein